MVPTPFSITIGGAVVVHVEAVTPVRAKSTIQAHR
jgi:hypothetical protein